MNPAEVAWLMIPDPAGPEPPTVDSILGRPPWMAWAACRGMGTELFIAARGTNTQAAGKVICQTCVVQPECLEYAMADDTLVGLWGATSERERARMRAGWWWERSQRVAQSDG